MEYHILFFFRKLRKMLQNLSSAAVVIGALRVNIMTSMTNVCSRHIPRYKDFFFFIKKIIFFYEYIYNVVFIGSVSIRCFK